MEQRGPGARGVSVEVQENVEARAARRLDVARLDVARLRAPGENLRVPRGSFAPPPPSTCADRRRRRAGRARGGAGAARAALTMIESSPRAARNAASCCAPSGARASVLSTTHATARAPGAAARPQRAQRAQSARCRPTPLPPAKSDDRKPTRRRRAPGHPRAASAAAEGPGTALLLPARAAARAAARADWVTVASGSGKAAAKTGLLGASRPVRSASSVRRSSAACARPP